MKTIKTTERSLWEELRTPKGRKEAEERQKLFRKIFPAGHRNSLRRDVAVLASLKGKEWQEVFDHPRLEYLREVHPKALGLLAQYGRSYRPIEFKEPPEWGEPMRAMCFYNAWVLVEMCADRHPTENITYVEGIARGVYVTAMLHGWNASGIGRSPALDWTHYAVCQWSRYFGIPFLREEIAAIRERVDPYRGKSHMSMFLRGTFPRVEGLLIEILSAR